MENRTYGYIRVSTIAQHNDRQRLAMIELGIEQKNLFEDNQSGRDFDRPAYKKLLTVLRPGDTLVIKSVDRLGRNYREILEQWRVITQEKHVSINVLDFPLLDTTGSKEYGLTGELIGNIMLALFSYVAETERNMNIQRTTEGIAAARQRGVKLGRKPKERTEKFKEYRKLWQLGEISAREAAKQLGITHPTFLRWVKE